MQIPQMFKDELYEYADKLSAIGYITDAIETAEQAFDLLVIRREQDADLWEDGEAVANMARRAKLERDLEICRRDVELVRDALDTLTEDERHIIDLFYIHRPEGGRQAVLDALFLSKSTAYRKRDEACAKLARAMYGAFNTQGRGIKPLEGSEDIT